MATNDSDPELPEVPDEATSPEARRRETMLAFLLGAIDDEAELALLRGRLETDPEWKKAHSEATAMLKSLEKEGPAEVEIPEALGERTVKALRAGGNLAGLRPSQQKRITPIRRGLSFRAAAAIFAVCAIPALLLGIAYLASGSESTSLYWRSEAEVSAGAPFSPYLLVRDMSSRAPLEGTRLSAYLTPVKGGSRTAIGEGRSDVMGLLRDANWRIPDLPPAEYTLDIEAQSSSGARVDHLSRSVKLVRSAKLVLSPDRLQARPGESIRARALLVSSAVEKPMAGEDATISLFDPSGNRVGRATVKTTEFGLAWAIFPLDELAPEGTYRLRAEAGGISAESRVEVLQYVLPPFKVTVSSPAPWIALGQPDFSVQISAATFDGHPLGGASGELVVMDTDARVLTRLSLKLDGGGSQSVRVNTPLFTGVTDGAARGFNFEANLTDAAGRRAKGTLTRNASRGNMLFGAIAEAGELVQGVNNRVFLIARTPDGTPAKTSLMVKRDGSTQTVQTDEFGVGVYELNQPKLPAEILHLTASGDGATALPISLATRKETPVPGVPGMYGKLLLRTSRAVVRSGDTIEATLFAAERVSGRVILSLRQDGRTLALGGVDLTNGTGDVKLKIPTGASGVLSLEALLERPGNGETVEWMDRRMLNVAGSSNVRVAATAKHATYRPGDLATLEFNVTDAGGKGIPAAVSIVAVDEALLALTGEHPGLAQAMQSAGKNVLRAPNAMLDFSVFDAMQGANPAAAAAMALLKPRTIAGAQALMDEMVKMQILDPSFPERMREWIIDPKTEEDRQVREFALDEMRAEGMGELADELIGAGSDTALIIDTAPRKLAERDQARAALGGQIKQALWGLVVIAIVLYVLMHSLAPESMDSGVPLLSLLLFIIGVCGMSLSGSDVTVFGVVLTASLIAGHGILLLRSNNEAMILTTVITDLIVVVCLLGVTLADPWRRGEWAVFAVLASMAAMVFQHATVSRAGCNSVILRAAAALAGILVVASISIPSLLRSRMAAKSTAAGSMARTYMEAKEIYKRTVKVDPSAAALETAGGGPRVRRDFPETLIFQPQLVTDESGHATLSLRVADSLTTWRVLADAIAASGGSASTQCPLVVTQPFAVDATLPTDVTEGDELVVPVIVSNHGEQAREVKLHVELSGATVLDGAARTLQVSAKSVAAVTYRLRFSAQGMAALKFTGLAGKESDAVERLLPVLANGRAVAFNTAALVRENETLNVVVPTQAIPDTTRASLVFHRGPLTQMLEGLDAMLREPHGCFEQTSSTSYPNVMIVKYLRANNIKKPEIEKRAQDFMARGYQRLLGFEVGGRSGSFSLYGQAPASAWLTAYGLLQFTDTAEVFDVDEALLTRTRGWLKSRMEPSGAFPMDSHLGGNEFSQIAATAYVVWAIGKEAPAQSIEFLRARNHSIVKDPYLCALTAVALQQHDRATASQLAGKLRGLAVVAPDGKSARLNTTQTLAWSYGNGAVVEASALGALALLETSQDVALAANLVAFVQSQGSAQSGWGSTHATVLALKAMTKASTAARQPGPQRMIVEVNGRPLDAIELPADETEGFSLPLRLNPGASAVRIQSSGGGVVARVGGEATVPWSVAMGSASSGTLSCKISYDTQSVERDATVLGAALISAQRAADVPMLEWGLPAGFVAEEEDLAALKKLGSISRWEKSGRKLRLYLPDMKAGAQVTFSVRFRATTSGAFTSAASRAYEYYRASEATVIPPTRFEVK